MEFLSEERYAFVSIGWPNDNFEAWLDGQRTADKPDEAGWNRLLQSDLFVREMSADAGRILQEFCLTDPPEQREPIGTWNAFMPLLQRASGALKKAGYQVFYLYNGRASVCIDTDHPEVMLYAHGCFGGCASDFRTVFVEALGDLKGESCAGLRSNLMREMLNRWKEDFKRTEVRTYLFGLIERWKKGIHEHFKNVFCFIRESYGELTPLEHPLLLVYTHLGHGKYRAVVYEDVDTSCIKLAERPCIPSVRVRQNNTSSRDLLPWMELTQGLKTSFWRWLLSIIGRRSSDVVHLPQEPMIFFSESEFEKLFGIHPSQFHHFKMIHSFEL
jgi:hypothetical protein